jgi:hypothetical protein
MDGPMVSEWVQEEELHEELVWVPQEREPMLLGLV